MEKSEMLKSVKYGIVEICFSEIREKRYIKGKPLNLVEIRTILEERIDKYIELLSKKEFMDGQK